MAWPVEDSNPRWRTVAVVAVALLVAALLPSPFHRHSAFVRFGPDKLLHFLGHFGFAAILANAIAVGRRDERESALLAAAISVGYGLVTARLQRHVPGRVPERADLAAAALGSVLGALGWRRGRVDVDSP